MKCKYCGAEISERNNFCRKCGRGINGEVNTSDKKGTEERFKREIVTILKKFDPSSDKNGWDEALWQYEINQEKLDKLQKPVSPAKTITIIVTMITLAVFSILIPGLNIENENFNWIASNPRTALYFCSALGLMPTFALYNIIDCIYEKNWKGFGVMHIIVSLIIGAVGSVPLVLLLFFFKGFFGTGFKTFVIVAAIAFGIVAAINVIIFIANGQTRYDYYFRLSRLKDEEKNYTEKENKEIEKVKKKYEEVLSEKEMDSIVLSAQISLLKNLEILYVYPGHLSYDEWTIAYPPLGGMGVELGFKITTEQKVSSVEFYIRARSLDNKTIPPEKPSKRDSNLAMVKVNGPFERNQNYSYKKADLWGYGYSSDFGNYPNQIELEGVVLNYSDGTGYCLVESLKKSMKSDCYLPTAKEIDKHIDISEMCDDGKDYNDDDDNDELDPYFVELNAKIDRKRNLVPKSNRKGLIKGATNNRTDSTSSSSSSSGGCYIATCVYGSYDCPQVWTLRRYRDNILSAHLFGRIFIRVYYALSPTIVKLFGKNTAFRKFWRSVLDKKIKQLQDCGVEDTPYSDKLTF